MASSKDHSSDMVQESPTDTLDVDATIIPQELKDADSPPDGGYGWVCVGCVALVNAHTWGLNSVCCGMLWAISG